MNIYFYLCINIHTYIYMHPKRQAKCNPSYCRLNNGLITTHNGLEHMMYVFIYYKYHANIICYEYHTLKIS